MADSLFTELKRRNVFKVGVAYGVVSWILIQIITSISEPLNLPDWTDTLFIVFLAVGFPIALIFAWAFEVTPEGIKKESEIAHEASISTHSGRKLDFVIIGLLVLVAGYFIYESRFTTQTSTVIVTADSSTESAPPKEVISEPEGTSIAVLPFVNMSDDASNEYFSDGISEEILNVLAKLPNLKVTSRSSAFYYKDTKINISEVAKKLGVKNILEGSVRKSGNKVRITAQLIEAETDTHLWSETYDRELTDIFAIQDEIAAAIVEALKSKLGLEVKVAKRDMSKVNLEAHNEYLKGRFYVENRNQADLEKALAYFDKAIAFAPEYAAAWMGKGWATYFLSEDNYGNIPIEVALERGRPAIEKALQLDPELPEAHGVMGLIEDGSFETDKAIAHFKKAIELNPNYSDAHAWYSNAVSDQPKKRFELREKAVQLSPMSILANVNYAYSLIDCGRVDEAREVAEHMLTINDSHHFPYAALGSIQSIEGNYAESIISFRTALENSQGTIRTLFEVANPLAAIGLADEAATYFEGTEVEAYKYWYKGNAELYISQVRAVFPRNENDSKGLQIRALAEAHVENYSEAVKYFNLTKINETDVLRIYSYLQVGETEAAQALLDKLKAEVSANIDANVQYRGGTPIEIRVMEIAYFEGDIDRAIANLKQAMEKKYIIEYRYKTVPMYKKLREHPDWLALLKESDRRAAIQREIYLKLVAEEKKTIL